MKIEQDLIKECRRLYCIEALKHFQSGFNTSIFIKKAAKPISKKYGGTIRKTSGFFAEALKLSGINPDCCIIKKSNPTDPEYRIRLIEAIKHIEKELGTENLNDSTMNDAKRYISTPPSLLQFPSELFELSNKFQHTPKISLSSIQRRCFGVFGSWDSTLQAAGIDFSQVKRKKSKWSPDELVNKFDEFVNANNGVWTQTTIREQEFGLFKAIHNISALRKDGDEANPYRHLDNVNIFTMWVTWKYWKTYKKISFDEDWWLKNESSLKDEYDSNHRGQLKWSAGLVQEQALNLFSTGSDLNREELIQAPNGKALLASLRTSKYGTGKGEVEALKKFGLLTPNIRSLRRLIEDTPINEVWDSIRKILGKSLQDKQNYLSREYMCKHHDEVFLAAARWRNRLTNNDENSIDWANTLVFFGLNPEVFEIGASKRAKRGSSFQRFFDQMLSNYFERVAKPILVDTRGKYCANKSLSISECTHHVRCKPDFIFKDLIIDTKVGGSLATPDQLERYLDHSERVIVVTINDSPKEISMKNGNVSILRFADFIKRSHEILGYEISDAYLSDLNQVLKTSNMYGK